jgi:hypothetical protein
LRQEEVVDGVVGAPGLRRPAAPPAAAADGLHAAPDVTGEAPSHIPLLITRLKTICDSDCWNRTCVPFFFFFQTTEALSCCVLRPVQGRDGGVYTYVFIGAFAWQKKNACCALLFQKTQTGVSLPSKKRFSSFC